MWLLCVVVVVVVNMQLSDFGVHCPFNNFQGSTTDRSHYTFDKAQLGQWKLAVSDCLSVSYSRQSLTPST